MNLDILNFSLLTIWCFVIAALEVQTEGAFGWAADLPTARYHLDPKTGIFYYKAFNTNSYNEIEPKKGWNRFYYFYVTVILGRRDFTWYHRCVDAMQIFVGHLMTYSLFLGQIDWWLIEVRSWAFIFLAWSVEDRLWYLLNPLKNEIYNEDGVPKNHATDWFWVWQAKKIGFPKGIMLLFVLGVGAYAATFIPRFI